MQISCDTSKLEQSLKKFHDEAIRKMQGMVAMFSYMVTFEAIENTPYGDSSKYPQFYNNEFRSFWLEPKEGSAKGGWILTMNLPSNVLSPERAFTSDAKNIKDSAFSSANKYKLGDIVYIVNSVPYVASEGFTEKTFGSLEGGYSEQAPQGIMRPTVDMIMSYYQARLSYYYKES